MMMMKCSLFPEILLLAVSLALDACAAAVSSGISTPGFGWRQALEMGSCFGAFQCMMTLAGWNLGSSAGAWLGPAGDLLSAGLFFLMGGHMLLSGKGPDRKRQGTLTVRELTALAVATSVDALAAGVSLAFLEVEILSAALLIGAVAFLLSVLGGLAGRWLGAVFQAGAERAGGLVLLCLGLRILWEHYGRS